MTLNIREIYSPNFDSRPRKKKQIRFLIFHYTGMKSEKSAIQRLTEIQSEVGTHYFIKKNGEIILMVPDTHSSWHSGISSWGKCRMLNKYSLGIEISNPGHKFGYRKFAKKQIRSLIKLSRILIKKYKIKKNFVLGHSDIAPDRKLDPGEKFPWNILSSNKIGIWHNLNPESLIKMRRKKVKITDVKIFFKKLIRFGYPSKSKIVKNKYKYQALLVKAFQRRFRPELINGKIDEECMLILNKIAQTKV